MHWHFWEHVGAVQTCHKTRRSRSSRSLFLCVRLAQLDKNIQTADWQRKEPPPHAHLPGEISLLIMLIFKRVVVKKKPKKPNKLLEIMSATRMYNVKKAISKSF